MGEIGKFYGGLTGKSKEDFKDGNAILITYMNVYSNAALNIHPNDRVRINKGEKQRVLQFGDIVFTGSSEKPEECGFSSVVTEYPTEPLYLNSFCFFLRLDNPNIINPIYAKHLFRSYTLRCQIGKTANGVTRFNVSKDKMAKVRIPIPTLAEQARIASILDRFDALCNDLTAGLPAEIEARRKQYEYYRDQLLTFNEAQ